MTIKACIGFMMHNEAHWLACHLPIWQESGLPLVALDGGSTDGGTEIAMRYGATVHVHPFDTFGAQANRLLDAARLEGYDAMLRLDPDELMFPEVIREVVHLLDHYVAVSFPRLNFEVDRRHYNPVFYPDWQTRLFHLAPDIRYTGDVHESLDASLGALAFMAQHDTNADTKRFAIHAPGAVIYHYEGLLSPRDKALKHLWYKAMYTHEPARTTLEGLPDPKHRWHIPFHGPQPLDPDEVGDRAPFPDEMVSAFTHDNGLKLWLRDRVYAHDRDIVHEVVNSYHWAALGPLHTVMDIGAHIGSFTAEVKRQYPACEVVAVEPEQSNYDMALLNVGLRPGVKLYQGLVGVMGEAYWFRRNLHNSGGHAVYPLNGVCYKMVAEAYEASTVYDGEVFDLDTLIRLADWDYRQISLLKLDCEGAELEILNFTPLPILQRFNCIIGERHQPEALFMEMAGERLQRAGFTITHYPNPDLKELGVFVAHPVRYDSIDALY